jgi:hypothetical protein
MPPELLELLAGETSLEAIFAKVWNNDSDEEEAQP